MGRLTVRLPETLHKELTALAKQEGVSLNQYIVYALTRQATLAYTVQALPEHEVAQQQASFDEIEAALAERELVEPEPGLNRERVARLQERLAEYRLSDHMEEQNE